MSQKIFEQFSILARLGSPRLIMLGLLGTSLTQIRLYGTGAQVLQQGGGSRSIGTASAWLAQAMSGTCLRTVQRPDEEPNIIRTRCSTSGAGVAVSRERRAGSRRAGAGSSRPSSRAASTSSRSSSGGHGLQWSCMPTRTRSHGSPSD